MIFITSFQFFFINEFFDDFLKFLALSWFLIGTISCTFFIAYGLRGNLDISLSSLTTFITSGSGFLVVFISYMSYCNKHRDEMLHASIACNENKIALLEWDNQEYKKLLES